MVEVDCGENKGVWGFSVHGIEWHSIIKYILFLCGDCLGYGNCCGIFEVGWLMERSARSDRWKREMVVIV